MATIANQKAAPAVCDEFLVVDRMDKHFGRLELERNFFKLKEDIFLLKTWKTTCDKFQQRFFELFIAFTVLVTPLAFAFVFNYLFSSNIGNSFKITIYNCTSSPTDKAEDFGNQDNTPICYCVNSTSQHIRDAIVPVLIAISFIVGMPYYYHMLDELSHSNDSCSCWESSAEESDTEDDWDEDSDAWEEGEEIGKLAEKETMKAKKRQRKKNLGKKKSGDAKSNSNAGAELCLDTRHLVLVD